MVEVVVARIGRPHGIHGEVSVEVRTDDPEGRLAPGSTVRTDPASAGPLTITDGRVHSGRLLLTTPFAAGCPLVVMQMILPRPEFLSCACGRVTRSLRSPVER